MDPCDAAPAGCTWFHGSVAVSIVRFDQMYCVPISASSRFGTLAERERYSCELDSNARP